LQKHWLMFIIIELQTSVRKWKGCMCGNE
jgi:hypothetical protein